ncbi:hypothetical protein GmHk_17G049481 [Glycine max]|nr:hypothetical protein GmHk_17G049481 [Glycine max]
MPKEEHYKAPILVLLGINMSLKYIQHLCCSASKFKLFDKKDGRIRSLAENSMLPGLSNKSIGKGSWLADVGDFVKMNLSFLVLKIPLNFEVNDESRFHLCHTATLKITFPVEEYTIFHYTLIRRVCEVLIFTLSLSQSVGLASHLLSATFLG